MKEEKKEKDELRPKLKSRVNHKDYTMNEGR